MSRSNGVYLAIMIVLTRISKISLFDPHTMIDSNRPRYSSPSRNDRVILDPSITSNIPAILDPFTYVNITLAIDSTPSEMDVQSKILFERELAKFFEKNFILPSYKVGKCYVTIINQEWDPLITEYDTNEYKTYLVVDMSMAFSFETDYSRDPLDFSMDSSRNPQEFAMDEVIVNFFNLRGKYFCRDLAENNDIFFENVKYMVSSSISPVPQQNVSDQNNNLKFFGWISLLLGAIYYILIMLKKLRMDNDDDVDYLFPLTYLRSLFQTILRNILAFFKRTDDDNIEHLFSFTLVRSLYQSIYEKACHSFRRKDDNVDEHVEEEEEEEEVVFSLEKSDSSEELSQITRTNEEKSICSYDSSQYTSISHGRHYIDRFTPTSCRKFILNKFIDVTPKSEDNDDNNLLDSSSGDVVLGNVHTSDLIPQIDLHVDDEESDPFSEWGAPAIASYLRQQESFY